VHKVVPGSDGGGQTDDDALLSRNLIAFFKDVEPSKPNIKSHVEMLMTKYSRANVATSLFKKYKKVPDGWVKFSKSNAQNYQVDKLQAGIRGKRGRVEAAAKRTETEAAKLPPMRGTVRLHYSHYKKEVETIGGSLKIQEVDQLFSFSFVFKGEYRVHLRGPGKRPGQGPRLSQKLEDGEIIGLELGQLYWVEVDEDRAAESEAVKEKGATSYKAAGGGSSSSSSQSRAPERDEETKQLFALGADKIREGGDQVVELLEARELRSLGYS
jgi:hypothetical protein